MTLQCKGPLTFFWPIFFENKYFGVISYRWWCRWGFYSEIQQLPFLYLMFYLPKLKFSSFRPSPEVWNGKIMVSQAWDLNYNKPYFTQRKRTVTTARTSGFCTWFFNHCGILSVYKLINSVYATCIWEVILFAMIQLHILLMKHQPESCFQSYTNITSNLLPKHLFWSLHNKELTFNASITFAS